ncbi:MAG: hypothetical protein PSX36_04780 [bacterium]|nr:hypothetical protein [bacterium]
MKNLAVVILLSAALFCRAQPTSYSLKQDTCLDKKFSIVYYVFLDSSSVPFANTATLAALTASLNNVFSHICVSFMNCSTVYIPIYPYKGWQKSFTELAVTSTWYTEKTINFYIVDTVYVDPTIPEVEGYTYPPLPANMGTSKRDLLVVDWWRLMFNNCALPIHLLGHYFGLPHTHDEISPSPPAVPGPPSGITTQEFASQTFSNCSVHGDGFCDTEADPAGIFGAQDGQGNYYLPPTDNFMSSYNSTRFRFTPQQYYRMAYTIMTKRMYLH